MQRIKLGATTAVVWTLHNEVTNEYINNATATAVVKDSDGITLGNLTLSYTSGSNGLYVGYITPAMVSGQSEGDEVTVIASATAGTFTDYDEAVVTCFYGGGHN